MKRTADTLWRVRSWDWRFSLAAISDIWFVGDDLMGKHDRL